MTLAEIRTSCRALIAPGRFLCKGICPEPVRIKLLMLFFSYNPSFPSPPESRTLHLFANSSRIAGPDVTSNNAFVHGTGELYKRALWINYFILKTGEFTWGEIWNWMEVVLRNGAFTLAPRSCKCFGMTVGDGHFSSTDLFPWWNEKISQSNNTYFFVLGM